MVRSTSKEEHSYSFFFAGSEKTLESLRKYGGKERVQGGFIEILVDDRKKLCEEHFLKRKKEKREFSQQHQRKGKKGWSEKGSNEGGNCDFLNRRSPFGDPGNKVQMGVR